MIPKRINRRTMLKAAGVALPLPFLDVMSPLQAAPAGLTPAAPPRYVWFYQPCGFYPGTWNPKGEGLTAELPHVLEPFKPFQQQTTIIRNLWNNARHHAGNTTALLTGKMAVSDAESGRFKSAKSIDQYVADVIGNETPLRSLEMGIDSPPSGPCAATRLPLRYGATVSWQSPTRQRMAEVRPLMIFERLFGRGEGTAQRAAVERSVLDLVREEARDIQRIGSTSDKRKLEAYFDGVRSAERSVQRTLNPPGRAWTPPTRPEDTEFERPAPGVPRHRPDHMRALLDLLTLALWTDTTRVSTFMMGASQCNADFGFLPGVMRAFHEGCSHHGSKEDVIKQYVAINRWHAEQVAYFLNRLDSIDEGNGSLLDNSLIFFGSSLKDGQEHSSVDLPVAMFGNLGGRVRARGHVFLRDKTLMASLHRTTMHWYGVEADDFNDTGAKLLPGIG